MTRRMHLLPFSFLLLTLLSLLTHSQAADTWQAGAAKQQITPQQFMWMAGYGSRTAPANGKLTELWAKSLVVQDAEGHQGVLITLDLVGIDRPLATTICQRLEKKYGLQRDQIAICCSHTHTGPALKNNLAPLHYRLVNRQQQEQIEQYEIFLVERIMASVDAAQKQLAAATLSWGSGTATYATNRRENRPEGEVPERRLQGKLAGPVDHDVPVLAVHDTEQKLLAVVFGYACHATVLSLNQWSGDHPGYAQIELEQSHPGAVAMFWAGCGADQNPLPRRTVALAKHYGQRLTAAVDSVLMTTRLQPIAPRLTSQYREVALPLDTLPTRAAIEADTTSKNKFVAARAKMLLEQIDSGQPLAATYPYGIGSWRLGDTIDFVFLGGEVVVDYAIRLKAELRGKQSWIAGYANDVMAYIPSRRVLREGGYEGATSMIYYGLPTRWAPALEALIVDEVHRQVGPTAKK